MAVHPPKTKAKTLAARNLDFRHIGQVIRLQDNGLTGYGRLVQALQSDDTVFVRFEGAEHLLTVKPDLKVTVYYRSEDELA